MASNIDHGVFKRKSYSRLKVVKGAFDEIKQFWKEDVFFMLIAVWFKFLLVISESFSHSIITDD